MLPIVLALLALASPVPDSPGADLDDLAWMSGCWEGRFGPVHYEEQWMRPRGGTLPGMSRTVRDGRTVAYESMRIYEDGDVLVYAVQPSGQPFAEFRSVQIDGATAVFTNPAHDFPQTIRYERIGADSLHASISGTVDGAPRGAAFPMGRRACP